MKIVTVEVKVKLTMKVDDDVEVSEVIDEMEYDFSDTTGKAIIENTEILDSEVTDSE